MSTLLFPFTISLLKLLEPHRFPPFQVEAESGGLTWWGSLLILGLIILIVVLALAWNASKTPVHEVEHSSHEMHAPAPQNDDLTIIEGIGPKISSLLQENGITSFERLRSVSLNELQAILARAGLQFTDPTTWSEQAELAARADWEALENLKENLRGGRR